MNKPTYTTYYQTLSALSYFFATFIIFFIFYEHLRHITAPLPPLSRKKRTPVTDYGSLAVIVFFLLWNVNMLVSHVSELSWTPFNFYSDWESVAIGSLLYLCAKTTRYLLFVKVVQLAFGETCVDYQTKHFRWLYTMISMYVVAMSGIVTYIACYHREYTNRDMPFATATGFLLFDVVFSSGGTLLFHNAISTILKETAQSHGAVQFAKFRKDEPYLNLVPLRYAFVNGSASIATLLSLGLLATTGVGIFMPLDAVWNCMCIVLLTKAWNRQFFKTCGPLMICVADCPCLCGTTQDVQLVELIVGNFASASS